MMLSTTRSGMCDVLLTTAGKMRNLDMQMQKGASPAVLLLQRSGGGDGMEGLFLGWCLVIAVGEARGETRAARRIARLPYAEGRRGRAFPASASDDQQLASRVGLAVQVEQVVCSQPGRRY